MPVKQLTTEVVTAGTRVPLAPPNTKCAWASITADAGNSGNIYLGDDSVASDNWGAKLAPGDIFFFPVLSGENPYELSQPNIDADTDGDTVEILYYVN